MGVEKFPLCRQAGLELFMHYGAVSNFSAINAMDVERLLESAPVVYGQNAADRGGWGFDQRGVLDGITTHTARLLLIEEIEKDKATEVFELMRTLFGEPVNEHAKDKTMREIRKLLDKDGG